MNFPFLSWDITIEILFLTEVDPPSMALIITLESPKMVNDPTFYSLAIWRPIRIA
jgi:hypothetical protein